MSVKEALDNLRTEFVDIVRQEEEATHQKCAQVILAASGLTLLREKIASGIVNRRPYFDTNTES